MRKIHIPIFLLAIAGMVFCPGRGAIGDLSSITYLLKAVDLESGLSLASIVWMPGELRAEKILPELVNI